MKNERRNLEVLCLSLRCELCSGIGNCWLNEAVIGSINACSADSVFYTLHIVRKSAYIVYTACTVCNDIVHILLKVYNVNGMHTVNHYLYFCCSLFVPIMQRMSIPSR